MTGQPLNIPIPPLQDHRPVGPPGIEPGPAGLNRLLTRTAALGRANESFLTTFLQDIDSAGPSPAARRLLLARLAELTLWTAGAYADWDEPAAAGDLLVNPRQKLLLAADRSEPIVLERHGRLTDQVIALRLVPAETKRSGVIAWLKENTKLITRPPLLVELRDRLRADPGLTPDYLESVDHRMGRIASTIGFLANLHLPPGRSIQEHLRLVSPEERACLESRLCGFDLNLFDLLGELIAGLKG